MPHLFPVFAAMADAGATASGQRSKALFEFPGELPTDKGLIGWIASYRPCAQFLAQCCEAKRPRT